MKIQTITRAFFCTAFAGFAAMAQAQSDITWQSPITISGASDVNTSGTLFGTWAPFNGGALSGLTVNGVTFQAFPDLPGAADSFDNGGGNGTFNSPGTLDNNYNTLLNAAAFGNGAGPYTVSWNGMTTGNTYLVQFWVNDARNSTANARSETLTGGANTSAALKFGSGETGPGQYIIGTFVAGGASESLTVNADVSAQFNLIQVRDITPVPEPSTMALCLAGFGMLLVASRKK
ncbi:MAG TPA: PEP-CTERM sorting domain-containing protein [Verrucomicrobiae bacterium]|jgi:hypothetical protein|nr:PEP-CTERM sorting domain-containing protein [Verrucomicrobiae bacterium]